MTTLTEGQHNAEFVVTEADGTLSRDSITVLQGQNLQAGHVLGQVTVGAVSAAATAGNTGNGAIGSVSAGSTAKPGAYVVSCVEHATGGGVFLVENPDGVTIGKAVVGTAYAGPVNFTIAAGATDFAAGDRFTVTVAAGSGKYKEYNPANTDGSEVAVAVLVENTDATLADKPAVAITRQAEINAAEIVWFTGATSDQKAAGLAQLQAKNIIARPAN